MRNKWFWMARIKSKLSLADTNVFEVALFTPDNWVYIAQRIWELNRYIGNMKKRPEFNI